MLLQGNRNRKFDLCIKGCLGSKKSASYEIPRALNTVENLNQHLLFKHFKFMFHVFLISHQIACITLTVVKNLIKIIRN